MQDPVLPFFDPALPDGFPSPLLRTAREESLLVVGGNDAPVLRHSKGEPAVFSVQSRGKARAGSSSSEHMPGGFAETAAFVKTAADPNADLARDYQAGAALYDGLGTREEAVLPAAADVQGSASQPRVRLERSDSARTAPVGRQWTQAQFKSVDGLQLFYKFRGAEEGSRPPMIFVGGIGLAEVFDTFFEHEPKARSDQYFLWLRGHHPSGFKPTAAVLEADARDLARMIVLASERSDSKAVDLTVHSYGGLVFQKMVQLRGDREVQQALRLLKGGKVTLFNTATHYGHSEAAAGEQYAQMAKIVQGIVLQGELMDAYRDAVYSMMRTAPQLFSFMWSPVVFMQMSAIQFQRNMLLAVESGVNGILQALSGTWASDIDGIRLRALMDAYQEAVYSMLQAVPQLFARMSDSVVSIQTAAVQFQRNKLFTWAVESGVKGMLKDLSEPWASDIDFIRLRILKIIQENLADDGWKEAFLRRARDTSLLDFKAEDVERIRENGIRLEFVHAGRDQMVPWISAKLCYELFGIPVPERTPAPGSEFRDRSGLFRMRVVDSDHYYPLREPEQLERQIYP